MPRTFRVYDKKRGRRRTGSKLLGSAGEAIYFACIFGVGMLVLVLLLKRLVIPEWRANHAFEETVCEVLHVRNPVEIEDDDGKTYKPMVEIAYTVNGQRYISEAYDIAMKRDVRLVRLNDELAARELIDEFKVGETYPCWYDPTDPETVVLVRGYTWWLWVLLVLPVAFIGIGGVGLVYALIHWGKSAEHRAATQLRGPQLAPLEPENVQAKRFPNVPAATNLTNSPGTTLAFRLPIHSASGWRLFATAAVCAAWNSIVLVFVVMGITGLVRGTPDWQLLLFTLPFLAGGIGLVYLLFREAHAAAGPGPTHLEICDHPLLPGHMYGLFITQAGQINVRSFQVVLACDEEVNFYQGTDVRTERRRVYEEPVYKRDSIEILPGVPFQDRCEVHVPDDAMHSFKAENNEVQWKLIARIEIEHRAPLERVFPIIVRPLAVESSVV